MTMSRRDFMRQSSVAAAATSVWTLSERDPLAADEGAMPIIDTHQHLWDLAKFKLPWLADAPDILRHNYGPPQYGQAVMGLNVVKAVYMEVDVDASQQSAEADYLTELCSRGGTPTVAAVISGRPGSESFREYILKYKGSRYIKGVRQVLHNPDVKRGLCLEKQFVQSIQLLGELNMSFDLCLRPGELADAVKLVGQCPKTRFIVDHCGNADPRAFLPESARGGAEATHDVAQWKRDMAALAKNSNVVCKISGIVARAPAGEWKSEILAPIVNYCLDTFGPDHVMFGGDWPVCLLGASYRRWVESLREIVRNRSEADRRKLWHDNAARFYALS